MGHDVFISYSTFDKLSADALCMTLESRGIRCWIAHRDIPPGVVWPETIMKAIRSCRMMVLVFSSHANESEHVKREVNRAFELKLKVIPLRVEDVEPVGLLEYYFGQVNWFDVLTPPLERHLQSFATHVESLLGSRVQDPGPDPRPGPSILRGPSPEESVEKIIRPESDAREVNRDRSVARNNTSPPTTQPFQVGNSERGSETPIRPSALRRIFSSFQVGKSERGSETPNVPTVARIESTFQVGKSERGSETSNVPTVERVESAHRSWVSTWAPAPAWPA
jgi:TIR domain